MDLTLAQGGLGFGSGTLVGLTLGLVGGGGSILAVPLLVYLVGVANPHVAIGTSAVAVAVSAAANLATHARAGNVKWRCASVFAAAGVVGAYGGSSLGKLMNGASLLGLFALLMLGIGLVTVLKRGHEGKPNVRLSRDNALALVGLGLGAGALSGFFGVGGGFLIVPGLVLATGMPTLYAVGSSLLAVTAFGATTAANYAASGLVDWPLAAAFVAGGLVGGLVGTRAAARLSVRKGALDIVFGSLVVAVALYMLARTQGLL
ncbi:MAG: hypothetical protein JWN93_3366 [Hyphomicrobiales bacterium]|nr:hypothetical protein [Hyphomicrobiales bacterium]